MAADDAFNSQGLRKGVTLQGIRDHQQALQLIADANRGTRASGTTGYDASVDYVQGKLEAAGYDVTRQQFAFPYQADESSLAQVAPTPTTYQVYRDFRTFTFAANASVTAQVAAVPATDATPGCEASDFATGFAGKIALVSRGPAGCGFRLKVDNAVLGGAVGVIVFDNVDQRVTAVSPTLSTPGVTVPTLFTTRALGLALRALAEAGPLTLAMESKLVAETRMTENVFAETAAGDPDRTVVVGAHLDSVPAGPGINDNGSGSATILEIAEQYAARGLEPRNRVRFAWFGAEERGLLGAHAYVDSLVASGEIDEVMLNLNFDMVGSPNYARFVYDGDNSGFPVGPGSAEGPEGSGLIEAVFVDYFRNQGLPSEPTPFSGRSDYGPFIEEDIPAGGLFTGAEGIMTAAQAARYDGQAGVAYDVCYHAFCDTFANVNLFGLDTMADGAAHAVYTFGLTREPIVDGGVLRPGTTTPDGDNDGGTDGGGGLHPEHPDDAE
jgi:Zn-dependent M28 family amino/carboxypeptidase